MSERGFWDFRSWFHEEFFHKAHDRFPTFSIALNWFLQNYGETIVETGTIRDDDWNSGSSTRIFGAFTSKYKKRLYTVDAHPDNLEISQRLTVNYADTITYVLSDSVDYLNTFQGTIDLLYLDSRDYQPDEPGPSQDHNLAELRAALPRLSKRSCVLIDDNEPKAGGKGELSKKVLLEYGYICLLDMFQSCWVRL